MRSHEQRRNWSEKIGKPFPATECFAFASQYYDLSRVGEIITMETHIRWENDLEMALSMARVQEKNLLLDFFNPG
jgi:hypothetical protein